MLTSLNAGKIIFSLRTYSKLWSTVKVLHVPAEWISGLCHKWIIREPDEPKLGTLSEMNHRCLGMHLQYRSTMICFFKTFYICPRLYIFTLQKQIGWFFTRQSLKQYFPDMQTLILVYLVARMEFQDNNDIHMVTCDAHIT